MDWLPFLGGLSGALIGGLITIYLARKEREHADQHRYSPERFNLYREYLDMCHDRVVAVKEQVRVAHQFTLGRVNQTEIPTLGTTADLERKHEQVQDIFPPGTLAPLIAHTLLNSVRMLDMYAYRAGHVATDLSDAKWLEQLKWYEDIRDFARNAFQTELGAVPPRRTSLRRRIQMRLQHPRG